MSGPRREVLADGVELWLGDCREVLPTISVDHVISDPPYENELHAAVGRIRRKDGRVMIDEIGFSGVNADRAAFSKAIVEASHGWAVLFTLAEGVRSWRDDLQAASAKYDTCLFWIKPDASPRFNGQGAARGAECAVTAWCGTGYRSWNGGGRRGVFTHCVNVGRQGEHPTEKPLPLMLDLVSLYTNAGESVCDPFCGSGTTGIAAVRLGRRFVGIEQQERWFDLSCQRIKDELRRPRMDFGPPTPAKQQSFFGKFGADPLPVEREAAE